MPTITPTVAQARARRAAHLRHGNTAQADEAGQDLKFANLEREIERAVSTLPPLTPRQRERLALLLNNGGADR